jgi:hypothetical protein
MMRNQALERGTGWYALHAQARKVFGNHNRADNPAATSTNGRYPSSSGRHDHKET